MNYLKRNPADVSTPIKDNFKRTNSYRFEDFTEDSAFDTKNDLMEAM